MLHGPASQPHVDIAAPIARELSDVLDVFDRELQSDLPFVNRLTQQVRNYRGKLLRPKLLLLAGRAAGELSHDHVVLAAVVEMVHMATLVHDDVLDEADMRRRHATVNRLVGNEGAVMLGDFLISHAYHLCSSLASTFASRRIAAVTNTVCEGELLQIENRGNVLLSEETYFEIIRRKTAALTAVCCEMGARASGADDETIDALARYGNDLGIAFQIVDDLLDLTASEQETGKSVGRDAEMGKPTLPVIRFLAGASPTDRDAIITMLSSPTADTPVTLRTMLAGTDAVDQAFDTAASYVTSATAAIASLPDGDAKASLTAAAEFVLARRQ
ncbi:MAG: polyprenyl synthetase family protein [Phycisphaerales bacterium]|nr:polyprenyl synthetase family protein [Phycisphaerales bacterium]MCB9862429.1 polyprenyl synthetase family protein [Phycisphaerales bacterium]